MLTMPGNTLIGRYADALLTYTGVLHSTTYTVLVEFTEQMTVKPRFSTPTRT